MQRIERYGVIALVLLLVTIAAVSFWDDGAAKPERDSQADTVAAREARREQRAPRSTRSPRIGDTALPETAMTETARPRPAQREEAAGRERPRRSHISRSSGRRSSEPTFDTVPATRVARGDSEEVEFPAELAQRQAPRSRAVESRDAELRGAGSAGARELGAGAARRERVAPREQPAARRPEAGSSPVAGARTYTVQPGDTLSQIAERTLGSSRRWVEIGDLNGGLDPAALHVGQVLKLPGGATAGGSLQPVARGTAAAAAPRAAGGDYVVRVGDSLSQIAQDQLGGASRWKEIVDLNPGLDPNRLMVGQSLRLPDHARRERVDLDLSSAGLVSYADPAPRSSAKKNRVR